MIYRLEIFNAVNYLYVPTLIYTWCTNLSVQVTKRRVQRLGGSSLIVTLPKNWVKKLGLIAGDEVIVVDEGTHLKILPSTGDTERRLKSMIVKYSSNTKNLKLSEIVECAFIKGVDWLYIYPSRSTLHLVEEGLKELENSDYAIDAKLYPDYLEIRINKSNTESSTLLRDIRKYMMEAIYAEKDELDSILKIIEERVNELTHIMFKRGIMACQETPIDPTAVGILKTVIIQFRNVLHALHDIKDKENVEILRQKLSEIILSVMGGLSNNSIKRLGIAREEISLLIDEISKYEQVKYILGSFLESLILLINSGACSILREQGATDYHMQ